MCDQTIPYSYGTPVWAYLLNRIWWPCRIVNPNIAPKEIQDLRIKKKNSIALVHFEADDQYEIIVNIDKIFLYDCPRKMEFLERGYELYTKQKKSTTTIKSIDMGNFVKDVVSVEKEIDGDVNIFNVLEKKNNGVISKENLKQLIKQLFVSSKDVKKKKVAKTIVAKKIVAKKIVAKKIVAKKIVAKKIVAKKIVAKKTLLKTKKTNKTPVKTEEEGTEASTSQTTSITSLQTNHDEYGVPTPDLPIIHKYTMKYICRMSKKCSFTTECCELAKQHIRAHQKNGKLATVPKATTKILLNISKNKVDTKALPKTQNKRKSTYTKKQQLKRTKIHDELLKDWVDKDTEADVDKYTVLGDGLLFRIIESKYETVILIVYDELCCELILYDKVVHCLAAHYQSTHNTDNNDSKSDSEPDNQHETRSLDQLPATVI